MVDNPNLEPLDPLSNVDTHLPIKPSSHLSLPSCTSIYKTHHVQHGYPHPLHRTRPATAPTWASLASGHIYARHGLAPARALQPAKRPTSCTSTALQPRRLHPCMRNFHVARSFPLEPLSGAMLCRNRNKGVRHSVGLFQIEFMIYVLCAKRGTLA